MSVKRVARVKVDDLIKNTKGHWFGVTFIKKDKSVRKMTARLGVKKGVKGTAKTPAAGPHNPYLVVWDSAAEDFRMVNLDTVQEVRFKGDVYKVEG